MSELSKSIHFWHTPRDAVRQPAASARAAGRIVASNTNWTCVVPFESAAFQQFAAAAPILALVWSYYDDAALNLEFVEAGSNVGVASLIWEPRLAPSSRAGVDPALVSLLIERGVLSRASAIDFLALAQDVSNGEIAGEEVRDRVATLLGLAAYEWLSPEACVSISLEHFKSAYPEAEDLEIG